MKKNTVITVAKTKKTQTPGERPKVVSRTTMTKLINNSKGKFFTSTHIDKNGQPRTMNAVKAAKSAQTDLGYITVYSTKDRDYRNINPQTLTHLSIAGINYKARK